jgi:predicted enzyme related to lactoylglutathione lyase
VQTVRDLGGTVIMDTFQTPFGRQCVIADPTGAVCMLIDGHKP